MRRNWISYSINPGAYPEISCFNISKSNLSFDDAKLDTNQIQTKLFDETIWTAKMLIG